ncbi:sugar phosphate isomerase/epimerase family protein [Salibacterium qingdaonense]|uniref:Sugar phosphate isomerase/epimerase n=1 Tax=Salibacterium qingdaonense TaxID=266892 RepID=A0A1I4LDA1_9BACI|nr:sugar phosphate isomerase/epimerase [Salibacterium qingdaonense]SFL88836.1 Sugar phosphate isomerase/epimerase [Salibacterium qingdaonense]
MDLGVFTVLFQDRPLEEALDLVKANGLDAVEIGTGGHPGNAHCDPVELLNDDTKRREFQKKITDRGLKISALSCHSNPLHPDPRKAAQNHELFEQTVRLAAMLGVKHVITFSGCPGESEDSKHPVWVTCPWPTEHAEVLEWQWREKVIPYWKEQDRLLKEHGVLAAIEPHPGFNVYNTETSIRLREACGTNIGVNMDPSHFFWQGMDPVASIKKLAEADALFYFHAKDTSFDAGNTAVNGVLDTKPYTDEWNRSWMFRTIGYGQGEKTWRDIISALQLAGYEGVVSIEHEDSLMSVEEGFEKASAFLRSILIRERIGEVFWV